MENLTGIDVQELEEIVERYEQMVTERKLDFNFQPNQLPFFWTKNINTLKKLEINQKLYEIYEQIMNSLQQEINWFWF